MNESQKLSEELKILGRLFRDGAGDTVQRDFAKFIEKLNSYIANDTSIKGDTEKLNKILHPIHEALLAQEKKDWVLLGDILEFEIAPLVID